MRAPSLCSFRCGLLHTHSRAACCNVWTTSDAVKYQANAGGALAAVDCGHDVARDIPKFGSGQIQLGGHTARPTPRARRRTPSSMFRGKRLRPFCYCVQECCLLRNEYHAPQQHLGTGSSRFGGDPNEGRHQHRTGRHGTATNFSFELNYGYRIAACADRFRCTSTPLPAISRTLVSPLWLSLSIRLSAFLARQARPVDSIAKPLFAAKGLVFFRTHARERAFSTRGVATVQMMRTLALRPSVRMSLLIASGPERA